MKVPILIPNIFNHAFTYESDLKKIHIGDYVKVPFGKKEVTGIVWKELEITKKKFILKKISKKLEIPNLNSKMIDFIVWFSKYNLVPVGMVLKSVISESLVTEKKFLKEYKKFKVLQTLRGDIL